MNNIYVDNIKLSKFKKLNPACNSESTLYTDNNTLYKVLKPFCRDKVRERNIELLSEYNHPNCMFPKDKLISKDSQDFIGITLDYLKDYITLSDALIKRNMTFSTRKDLAHKICKINKDLEELKVSFVDIHPDNIMINNNYDIKLIDLDSSDVLKRDYSNVFKFIKNELLTKQLATTCFLLLYGYDFDIRRVNMLDRTALISHFNKYQRKLLETVFLRSKIINVDDYIDEFNEQDMEESKIILRK